MLCMFNMHGAQRNHTSLNISHHKSRVIPHTHTLNPASHPTHTPASCLSGSCFKELKSAAIAVLQAMYC